MATAIHVEGRFAESRKHVEVDINFEAKFEVYNKGDMQMGKQLNQAKTVHRKRSYLKRFIDASVLAFSLYWSQWAIVL